MNTNSKTNGVTSKVALMSIQPQFVEEIIKGKKTFEFRKAVFKQPVEEIVIYCSKPVGKVIGEFTIKKIHEGNPHSIWNRTSEMAGVTETFFFKYFEGKHIAYAIELDKFSLYAKPVSLKEFAPYLKTPPQSYCYLKNDGK